MDGTKPVSWLVGKEQYILWSCGLKAEAYLGVRHFLSHFLLPEASLVRYICTCLLPLWCPGVHRPWVKHPKVFSILLGGSQTWPCPGVLHFIHAFLGWSLLIPHQTGKGWCGEVLSATMPLVIHSPVGLGHGSPSDGIPQPWWSCWTRRLQLELLEAWALRTHGLRNTASKQQM